MKNDLSRKYQERLEKWRKNSSQEKGTDKSKSPSQTVRRQVRKDYGDDISDYQKQGK